MEGSIYWLPRKNDIEPSVLSNANEIDFGVFGHPVILFSTKSDQTNVEICVVSFTANIECN